MLFVVPYKTMKNSSLHHPSSRLLVANPSDWHAPIREPLQHPIKSAAMVFLPKDFFRVQKPSGRNGFQFDEYTNGFPHKKWVMFLEDVQNMFKI